MPVKGAVKVFRDILRTVAVSVGTLALAAVVGGCYTVLKHPSIETSEGVPEDIEVAKNCTDCHSELYLDSYYHNLTSYYYEPLMIRRYFYYEPYYYRWRYYSYYPWWWDDYAYDYYYRPFYYDPKYGKAEPPKPQKRRDWDRRGGMTSEPPSYRTKSSGHSGGGISPGPSDYEGLPELRKPEPTRERPSSPLIYRSRGGTRKDSGREVRTKPVEKKSGSKDDEEKKRPKRRKGMD